MHKELIEKEMAKGANASIINVINLLIEHASQAEASDIHIDPHESCVNVRFRIDGVLHNMYTLPKEKLSEVISRIKIMSNLRTDEHQAAQDGRFRNFIKNGSSETPVDIRVSIVPTYYGPGAVMRVLTDKLDDFSLEKLGFEDDDCEKIKRAARSPYGMILVTGPTGSGKTTTLYTILKSLDSDDVSIITVEDPIEYSLQNIKQIPVNSRAGLTFASGLRSILRQDPNVIMVGEIRDEETARLAV